VSSGGCVCIVPSWLARTKDAVGAAQKKIRKMDMMALGDPNTDTTAWSKSQKKWREAILAKCPFDNADDLAAFNMLAHDDVRALVQQRVDNVALWKGMEGIRAQVLAALSDITSSI
jgi:hypothetical protein